jgi:hypothetical protein
LDAPLFFVVEPSVATAATLKMSLILTEIRARSTPCRSHWQEKNTGMQTRIMALKLRIREVKAGQLRNSQWREQHET